MVLYSILVIFQDLKIKAGFFDNLKEEIVHFPYF